MSESKHIIEKNIEKVRKLLAMADPNKNTAVHEAQTAMLKAQECMARYGITVAQIDEYAGTSQAAKEPNATEKYGSRDVRNLPWWHSPLAKVIADNFRCKRYIATWKGGYSCISFVGLEDDVDLACEVFSYAIRAVKYYADRYARNQYAKGIPMAGLRDEFSRGFINGLHDAYKEQVSKNSWQLVLVLHPAVNTFYQALDLITVDSKDGKYHIAGALAREAGYEKGKAFTVVPVLEVAKVVNT